MAVSASRPLLTSAEYTFADNDEFHPPLNSLQIRLRLGKAHITAFPNFLTSFGQRSMPNRDDSEKPLVRIACQHTERSTSSRCLSRLTTQHFRSLITVAISHCTSFAVTRSIVFCGTVDVGDVVTLAARNCQGGFQSVAANHTTIDAFLSSIGQWRYRAGTWVFIPS